MCYTPLIFTIYHVDTQKPKNAVFLSTRSRFCQKQPILVPRRHKKGLIRNLAVNTVPITCDGLGL